MQNLDLFDTKLSLTQHTKLSDLISMNKKFLQWKTREKYQGQPLVI